MSNMYQLYQMSEGIIEIDRLLSSEEITEEEYNDMKESFDLIIADEAEGIIKYTRNLSAGASAIDLEIKRLQAMKKSVVTKQNKVMQTVKEYMEKSGVKKLETSVGNFSLRKTSGSVLVEDESKIPSKFMIVTQTQKPDKAEIKKALKSGKRVLGASLVEGSSISIK